MNDFNSLNIEGTVSKDPIFHLTTKNVPICIFPMAVQKMNKDGYGKTYKEISFFEVEAWGNEAKKCKELAHIGRRCRIWGRLRQDRWKNRKNEPRSKVVIYAEYIEFRTEIIQEEGERDEQN